jgi:cbb3-type cytochrome oxidase cytochrome c subunit
MGRNLAMALIAAAAALVWLGYLGASAPDGAELFVRENCDKCHTLRGEGLGTHNLTGISERRSRTWLRDQIVNPRLHDPHPGMPSFAHLSRREVEALIDYLDGG